MANFPVTNAKQAALVRRMRQLGIEESDLQESFLRGGGPGGQKINRSASCVRLRHVPTNLEVRCQQSRSQAMNRFLARRELCDRRAEQLDNVRSRRQQEIEKVRRRKRDRSRRQKQRMLEEKRRQSKKKNLRQPPSSDPDG